MNVGGGAGLRSITAADVASAVGGELVGVADQMIRGIAPLDRAGESDVSFLASSRYAEAYGTTRAGVVLIRPEFRSLDTPARSRVLVAEPHEAVLRLIGELYPTEVGAPSIHSTAVIGRGASIGEGVSVGAYSTIGDGAVVGAGTVIQQHVVVGAGVVLGRDCVLYPACCLYSGAHLGDRVVVHSGTRIASDGFGYVGGKDGHRKIRHIGRCLIGDDVEIGANSCIDRGSIDDTVVGKGTKIDNLVHVAHNVRIGERCLILAQVGIAGSSRVEDGAVLAGQVGVSGHLTIGKGASLGAQAGVISDVPAGEFWSGYPARPHRESMRAHAALFRLSGMMKKLERLLGRED